MSWNQLAEEASSAASSQGSLVQEGTDNFESNLTKHISVQEEESHIYEAVNPCDSKSSIYLIMYVLTCHSPRMI